VATPAAGRRYTTLSARETYLNNSVGGEITVRRFFVVRHGLSDEISRNPRASNAGPRGNDHRGIVTERTALPENPGVTLGSAALRRCTSMQ
jgi:hypothetical protein